MLEPSKFLNMQSSSSLILMPVMYILLEIKFSSFDRLNTGALYLSLNSLIEFVESEKTGPIKKLIFFEIAFKKASFAPSGVPLVSKS